MNPNHKIESVAFTAPIQARKVSFSVPSRLAWVCPCSKTFFWKPCGRFNIPMEPRVRSSINS